MPGGDKTGPQGNGPMTGRALGYCAGNDSPGFASGQGFGWGRGRGAFGARRGWFGRGFRWGYGAQGYLPNQDAQDRNVQSQDAIKQEMDMLRKRLSQLEKKLEDTRHD